MKVLVPVKRVVDFNVKVRVKADGSGVELANVKMSMNPFDEIAVEEAIRLKEKGAATERAASIGPQQRPKRSAPRSRWRRTRHSGEVDGVASRCRAKIPRLVDERNPGLVSWGARAIDDDSNQTGQMLAP